MLRRLYVSRFRFVYLLFYSQSREGSSRKTTCWHAKIKKWEIKHPQSLNSIFDNLLEIFSSQKLQDLAIGKNTLLKNKNLWPTLRSPIITNWGACNDITLKYIMAIFMSEKLSFDICAHILRKQIFFWYFLYFLPCENVSPLIMSGVNSIYRWVITVRHEAHLLIYRIKFFARRK